MQLRCVAALLALLPTCALAAPEADALDSALAADACARSDDASCALNLLQRHGKKLLAGAELVAEADELEPPAIEPALGGYPLGVPLSDMGIDELAKLEDSARQEIARRKTMSNVSDVVVDSSRSKDQELGTASCGYRSAHGLYGSALCFCQLAGNSGCKGSSCACPQGCDRSLLTYTGHQTVVFPNKARAHGCYPTTVLLTAPASYFSTPTDLKRDCGGAASSVIADLLRDSWTAYQTRVGPGPVNQCFHASHIASVPYLHLQTFCGAGSFHGMPTNNPSVGFCVRMESASQAYSLAARLAAQMH